MRFRSEQSGLHPHTPRVLSIVLAVTGLLYGLDGLLPGPIDGRAQTADRVFVVLIALCSAHLVWTLARIRRKKDAEPEPEEAAS